MTVCMDVNQKVVFFTPTGRAMVGAPPVNPEPGRLRAIGESIGEMMGEAEAGSPRDGGRLRAEGEPEAVGPDQPRLQPPPRINSAAAIPRFKRDTDIPWEVEARAWDALDPV